MRQAPETRIFRHAHMFCGIGAGARGFNMANPRVGNVTARFECAGGIDVDEGAIRNFDSLTGAKGTVLDLFDSEQYQAFHGRAPPAGWSAASPADIHAAFGPAIDVAFTSAPCKGFSGLLSATQSLTDRYQALNALTLRGVWLLCEAYKDDPIPIILFENVPRIANRGRPLLDQICAILRSYGYNVAETVHDCGELGGLAQSRKRFLLIARQREKVPPFVYQPHKHRLRGVGEVIGKLPLPGDPIAGPMHRVPALQWKTWVRLAFVPAGRDWRALNELAVEDGVLRDYGIVAELPSPAPHRIRLEGDPFMHGQGFGVCPWDGHAATVTSARAPGQGRYSVADPRCAARDRATSLVVTPWWAASGTVAGESYPTNGRFAIADPRPGPVSWNRDVLGVRAWTVSLGVVPARNTPTNGAFCVADPRPGYGPQTHRYVLGVLEWSEPSFVLGGSPRPTCGPNAVADPRVDGHPKSVQLGVRAWDQAAACVKGDVSVGTGPYAVADVRVRTHFNNVFRIVRFDQPATAIAGPGGPAGGACVADPRPATKKYDSRKYKVTRYDASSRAVIGASTTGDGAFAVADPRGGEDPDALHGKYPIAMWIGPARAVIAGRDNGAFAVADPRCSWGNRHENVLRVTPFDSPAGTVTGGGHSVTGGQPCVADERREHYQTCGHYGVVEWNEAAGTVSATIGHDNGRGNVADPRPAEIVDGPVALPGPNDRLVCRIVALDDTWHRPFTTLDLASLQSIVDPEEIFYQDPDGTWHARELFDLASSSDAMKREWIGNAVPSASARGIADTIGETLLLASLGETFTLSTREIWVKPLALALAVDTDQVAFQWDAQ